MSSFVRTHTVLWLAVVLRLAVIMAIPPPAFAQTAWTERFEGEQPSWQDVAGNGQHRVLAHRRVSGIAHSDAGCEWLHVETSGSAPIFFACDVGRPRIIDELAPSVWIKSDRPGPYLALRLVLPRTIDPRSGQALSTVLIGPGYSDVGRWQRLRMAGIPTLLTRQIHVLRTQFGPQVDGREAYLDAVLLNVQGGAETINLWIDDLEVAGHAATAVMVMTPSKATPSDAISAEMDGPALSAPIRASEALPGEPASPAASGGSWMPKTTPSPASEVGPLVPVRLPPIHSAGAASPAGKVRSLPPTSSAVSATSTSVPASGITVPPVAAAAPRRSVQLVGSVLLVDDRPMFPRAIQHCGEPLTVLKKMGFNAVWLRRAPAPEILEEANRLGLWLICPPPRDSAMITEIGPAFDSVLMWDLGSQLTGEDLEPTERWEKQVRAADRRRNRPLICCPRHDLRGYSRVANCLLIDRRPLGTSLQMTDYATWVRRQPLLARPGTPIWTTVQTQPNESLRQQIAALQPGSSPPLCVPSEQIRLLAYTAVASGSRGLLFLSDTPLDATDAETQQRATTLELLNLEMELMEPWAAAGSFVASAESSASEVSGAVLRTEHTRLLLPIWSASMSQCVPPQSAVNAMTLVVPGAPEASNAYELTPSGVQPLRHRRVAGGLSVTLDEFGLTAQVLLAQDPLVIGAVHRRASEVGPRAAELQRHLAVRKLNTVQAIAAQLASRTPVAEAARRLDTAREELQVCDRQLSSKATLAAAQSARRAMRSLRLVERSYWDAAVKGLSSPVTSPAAVSFETLPFHWRLVDRLATCRFGPTRVAGGDFEDIETMIRAGWRYVQHSPPSVQTAVDLAPDAAHAGRLGLRLAAAAADPKNPPTVIETPPVVFTSPSITVEAGQIVCIYGWARVDSPITGSLDGLLIVDSLTGEALADRIGVAADWRQFALYRLAPQSGAMCVSFALSGLGEARLDDVVIQVVDGSTAVSRR
jgi:hypothetical protein